MLHCWENPTISPKRCRRILFRKGMPGLVVRRKGCGQPPCQFTDVRRRSRVSSEGEKVRRHSIVSPVWSLTELVLPDVSFEGVLFTAISTTVLQVLDVSGDVRSVVGRFASLAALAFGSLTGKYQSAFPRCTVIQARGRLPTSCTSSNCWLVFALSPLVC